MGLRGARGGVRLIAGAAVMVALVAGGASAAGAIPQSPTATWVVSGALFSAPGQVHAIAVSGSVAYLGGDFSYVGPESGSFVSFDGNSGELQSPWPVVSGNVNASVADGSGGSYIYGSFQRVGNAPRSNLAHILSDGSVDPAFAPTGLLPSIAQSGGPALALAGSELIVAGFGVTAFDVATGAQIWHRDTDAHEVNAVAVLGSTAYIGGSFSSIGGSPRDGLAALDVSTGALTNWDPAATPSGPPGNPPNIDSLAIVGSTVYVGNLFTSVSPSTTRTGLGAFDAQTGAMTPWNPAPTGGAVFALAASGSTIYAGGSFSTVNGSTVRNGLAALDATTGTATSWNPNVNGTVMSLSVAGSNVFAGGQFTTVNGSLSRDNVAVFDATSGTATSFAPVIGGAALTIAQQGSRVVVGGAFQSVGGVRRHDLAAIDLTTGRATDWNPALAQSLDIGALTVGAGVVYVGGNFRSFPNQPGPNHLAAFDATSGAATGWSPNVNGNVMALALSGSTLYAGGTFSTVNGSTPRNNLAAFDTTTATATNWNPSVDGIVSTLALSGANVYAGGTFSTVNGSIARNRLAAFDTGTGAATSWNPNVDNTVTALSIAGSTIYVSGAFQTVNGSVARQGVAAFDAASGSATSWNPTSHGSAATLAASSSTVYVAWLTNGRNGPPTAPGLTAYDASTGAADSSWLPGPDNDVDAIAIAPSYLLAGGAFTSFSAGPTAQAGFAAFPSSGTSALTITYLGQSPAANAHGWNNGPVTLTWSCSAPGGVVSSTVSQTLSAEGAGQTATGTCTDVAGNTASDSEGGVNIDRTNPNPPLVQPDRPPDYPGGGGWYKDSVTVSFASGGDPNGANGTAGSGVYPPSLPTPETFNSNGTFIASATENDLAGNFSQPNGIAVQVDAAAPALTASYTKADGSTYTPGTWTNQAVTVRFACDDPDGSGVVAGSVSPSATVATQGENQSVTASCRDQVGHVTTQSFGGIDIDLTPPEAYVAFDPTTDTVALYATDSGGSGVAHGQVASSIAPGVYTISDNAGNTLAVQLGVSGTPGDLDVFFVSLSYNGRPAQLAPTNDLHFTWRLKKSGALQELRQDLRTGAGATKERRDTNYDPVANQTSIRFDGPDFSTVPGLLIVKTRTISGNLIFDP